MSRIGKKPVIIPAGTEVSVVGGIISVKGPRGTLSRPFGGEVSPVVADGAVVVSLNKNTPAGRALWGTTAAHISNMVSGVNKAFEKKLVVEGIGFKSAVKGLTLELALGFSHPVVVAIPTDLKVTAEKNVITISGSDIEKVGQFAASIRELKKPEPYKGKGIRYDGEVIRRKQGKKMT